MKLRFKSFSTRVSDRRSVAGSVITSTQATYDPAYYLSNSSELKIRRVCGVVNERADPQPKIDMETYQIELSADEVLVMAQITGALVGYAVPDRYWEREMVLSLFNKANEMLVKTLTAGNSTAGSNHVRPAPTFA
jgi:hypothetical protein